MLDINCFDTNYTIEYEATDEDDAIGPSNSEGALSNTDSQPLSSGLVQFQPR